MGNGPRHSVNVAYTTPSGRMHIGHGLGHVLSDVILRYGAMRKGQETFFGFGMHSTGNDLLKIIDKLGSEENLPETLSRYNISPEKRDEILAYSGSDARVEALVQEYRAQYQSVIERMGIKMDFDSFFSANQEGNQRYTQWTLKKLEERGLIVETESERPYCPKCDDIKHIDKDLSEVSVRGRVNWEEFRIGDGEIHGGDFECRLHDGEKIVLVRRKERAIDYANPLAQEEALKVLQGMEIYPRKYRKDLEELVRTRLAKPFERREEGNVGAISPFDESKRVEALSDSNIYMEFYAISQLLNRGELSNEDLTDSFFDYVLLGEGSAINVANETTKSEEEIENVRQQVNEIYPINVSVAGFEHLGVHVPFSLLTHAAILPPRFNFDEFLITSHITRDGEKMSKSKGNVVYLDDLLNFVGNEERIEGLSEEAAFDSVRFFLTYYQSLDKNFDWSDTDFVNVGVRGLRRYISSVTRAGDVLREASGESEWNIADQWFSTINERTTRDITERMDERDIRGALVSLVDLRGKAFSTYLAAGSPKKSIIQRFLNHQIVLGSPVVPRVTNELREKYGLSNEDVSWPEVEAALEFGESFEALEHKLKGKSYEKHLIGEVSSQLGRMKGRKEIGRGERVTIFVPTEYQREVLSNEKIPMANLFDIDIVTDKTSTSVRVKKD